MNRWISESGRDKNQIFMCPDCEQRVMYIDGDARKKYSRKKAQCQYRYCPWCGCLNVKVDWSEEK